MGVSVLVGGAAGRAGSIFALWLKGVFPVGVEVITSRRNPVVRAAAGLVGSARQRREAGLFLCEGARLCQDAALSDVGVEACFFTAQAKKTYAQYLEPVLKVCGQAYEVSQPVAQLLADTRNPQGIFCVCRRPQGMEGVIGFAPKGPCLVLENLQDPGNLGTVLRTAEALGRFRVFLLGDCCDPLSPKALRASMGAVFRMELALEASPRRLFGLLQAHGYAAHGAVPALEARPITELDFTRGRHAVLIGNEGSGLTRETAGLCTDLVTIPMGGRAESLNAAAAATVLLWEMARGRRV